MRKPVDEQIHPDPIADAVSRGLQRSVQIASAAITAAQVLARIHLTRTHPELASKLPGPDLDEQLRREQLSARTGIRFIRQPGWIRRADLATTAEAWGALVPYTEPGTPWYDASAARAVRQCEGRLRELHPYGMNRYDSLRSRGRPPAEAMREASPFFTHAPQPGGAHVTTSKALPDELSQKPPGPAAGGANAEPRPSDGAARSGPSEDAAVVEPVAAPPGRRAARPWELDFPTDIRDVVASAAPATPAERPRQAPAPATTRRPAKPAGQP
jgi:hypothetical protein